MAGNKGQERAELHRTIWGVANDLRGSVDGFQEDGIDNGETERQQV